MVLPAPWVFGYASVPASNIPVALYVIAQDPVGDGKASQWLIARSALDTDEDGMGFAVLAREGNEEVLWLDWVELGELEPSPPHREYVAIDCVNHGDGLDLPTLRAACPKELLRAGDGAWSMGGDTASFDIGSPVASKDPAPETDVTAAIRQFEGTLKGILGDHVRQLDDKLEQRLAPLEMRMSAIEAKSPAAGVPPPACRGVGAVRARGSRASFRPKYKRHSREQVRAGEARSRRF